MSRRRPVSEPEGITLARLQGAARFQVREQVDLDTAVRELLEISTDPRVLGTAAGIMLGAWRCDPIVGHDGDRAAELLAAAGADPVVVEVIAVETRNRLERGRAAGNGIGNPY